MHVAVVTTHHLEKCRDISDDDTIASTHPRGKFLFAVLCAISFPTLSPGA